MSKNEGDLHPAHSFPFYMSSLASSYLWYLYLQPRGIDKARVRYVQGLSLAPEMLAVSDSLEELKLKELKSEAGKMKSRIFWTESIWRAGRGKRTR
ncbi:MAG: hypothetical protein GKR95_06355 [Gammaproteobacteria bacterium]|nr:hypothetical protein [Gammaproteobacteria bacterium]